MDPVQNLFPPPIPSLHTANSGSIYIKALRQNEDDSNSIQAIAVAVDQVCDSGTLSIHVALPLKMICDNALAIDWSETIEKWFNFWGKNEWTHERTETHFEITH